MIYVYVNLDINDGDYVGTLFKLDPNKEWCREVIDTFKELKKKGSKFPCGDRDINWDEEEEENKNGIIKCSPKYPKLKELYPDLDYDCLEYIADSLHKCSQGGESYGHDIYDITIIEGNEITIS